jgi:DNA topoisomerase-3
MAPEAGRSRKRNHEQNDHHCGEAQRRTGHRARADTTKGKFEKHADHFENDDYVVTSAVGHLVEIKAPEEYDVKRGKWSFAHLPVVPPHFDLAPIDKAKSRLNAVVKLVKRKDVGAIINACDAGREGELIFRLIVQYAFGDKPHGKPITAPVAAEHDAAGHPRRL